MKFSLAPIPQGSSPTIQEELIEPSCPYLQSVMHPNLTPDRASVVVKGRPLLKAWCDWYISSSTSHDIAILLEMRAYASFRSLISVSDIVQVSRAA